MHERLINRPATGPELPTLLGVRYLLAAPLRCQQYVARFRWPRVDESPHFCMLENPVPVQRWTVVREAIAVPDEDAMLERVRAQPAGPVPVLAPPGMVPPTGDGVVALRSYAPGRARLSVTAHTPSLVLVRDSFLPGWNVAVDGTPVPIHPAAGIYFAVPVPAGVHDVVLEYRAPGFRAGVLVLLAWTLGAVGWWRVRARRMAVR
jgi:hypothetical protein